MNNWFQGKTKCSQQPPLSRMAFFSHHPVNVLCFWFLLYTKWWGNYVLNHSVCRKLLLTVNARIITEVLLTLLCFLQGNQNECVLSLMWTEESCDPPRVQKNSLSFVVIPARSPEANCLLTSSDRKVQMSDWTIYNLTVIMQSSLQSCFWAAAPSWCPSKLNWQVHYSPSWTCRGKRACLCQWPKSIKIHF